MGHTKLARSAMGIEARARREHNTVSRVIVSARIYRNISRPPLKWSSWRSSGVTGNLLCANYCEDEIILLSPSLVASWATFGPLPTFLEALILSDM